VATQTDIIVVNDHLLDVLGCAGTYPVRMRIVAHPTREFITVLGGMNTLQEFFLNIFKMILCIGFITSMTVEAIG
jgi:hypothetical protein